MGNIFSIMGNIFSKKAKEIPDFLIPPPVDPAGKPIARIVYVNEIENNVYYGYKGNMIATNKYNLFTFLPKNLFEQFQRIANIYFLFLLILMMIPGISALNPASTAFPLVVVLSLTAIKDGSDDYKRYISDREINNRSVEIIHPDGSIEEIEWHTVKVGMTLKIYNDEFVPADLILLNTGHDAGKCFVETAELDGETNLKLCNASSDMIEFAKDDSSAAKVKGILTCQVPNNDLHNFNGTFKLLAEERESSEAGVNIPLNADNILLRGMCIRNTPWILGTVVYAGTDTKLMQNSSGTRFKRTSLDMMMNKLILLIFLVLIFFSTFSAVALTIWSNVYGSNFQSYLPWGSLDSPFAIGTVGFFSFIILYNTFVPISLYVSVEFIRLGQSYLINWDLDMYDKSTNRCAKARTTTLNEQLGQIEYIFSDKTGTLTQNVMRYMCGSINGVSYGKGLTEAAKADALRKGVEVTETSINVRATKEENPWLEKEFYFTDEDLYAKARSGKDAHVSKYFRLLAVCHTVQIEEKEGKMFYAAQSPDESALTGCARNYGYVLKKRDQDNLWINVLKAKEDERYQILNVLEFNSDRKRMSIILRCPDGQIRLFCKGADNIMLARCKINDDEINVLNEHLNKYSTDGLRTLVLAEKLIPESTYTSWSKKFKEAQLLMEDREAELEIVNALIETDMELVGATAIEDRLQEDVPQVIANLRVAGLKIWVLTGDKQETAINIGFACQLLHNEQQIFVINENKKHLILEKIQALKDQADMLADGIEKALVITGQALGFALQDDIKLELLELASICRAVICCRVTPLQKALVVKLVKDNKNATTLAIGDGANDVSMIQAADIGIGISGLEGRQAVLASDYSISQFRFLERLLLIHGRWSYIRMTKFLRYFFYKNFAFTLTQFWYAWFNGWSGQTVADSWFVTFYNVIFTALPIIAVGIFDQDVNAKSSLEHPKLYSIGQEGTMFNYKIFIYCWILAMYHSAVMFFVPMGCAADYQMQNGKMGGYQWFSSVLMASVVIVVNVMVSMDTYKWNFLNIGFVIFSISSWWLFAWYMYSVPALIPSLVFYGIMFITQGEPMWWFAVMLTVAIAIIPVIFIRYIIQMMWPSVVDVVRERTGNDRHIRRKSRVVARPGPRGLSRGDGSPLDSTTLASSSRIDAIEMEKITNGGKSSRI